MSELEKSKTVKKNRAVKVRTQHSKRSGRRRPRAPAARYDYALNWLWIFRIPRVCNRTDRRLEPPPKNGACVLFCFVKKHICRFARGQDSSPVPFVSKSARRPLVHDPLFLSFLRYPFVIDYCPGGSDSSTLKGRLRARRPPHCQAGVAAATFVYKRHSKRVQFINSDRGVMKPYMPHWKAWAGEGRGGRQDAAGGFLFY
ncbi:hypothetical protein EVAR_38554_1 [Eumeta japonica]|uniref:Uncharacterized protein n=1 Tax=Eumeta variegata TaxID=151549 RepID=A0A4C1WB10_EUMVA|nr:hypothetical protein EVAR_38554_1 [Eumeta japonica]